MSQYTRMMIMETLSDTARQNVSNILDAHVADLEPGEDDFVGSARLSEDGGRMIVFEMIFHTRNTALAYGASRPYRRLIESINHLLVGDPVIKLFARYSYTEVFSTEGRKTV